MRVVTLSPVPMPTPVAAISGREQGWLRAIREGRYACRWHRVGDVMWSTAVMVDGVRIALSYRSALEAATAMGAQLPTQTEADAMFRAARHVDPVVIRPTEAMASTEAVQRASHELGAIDDLVDNEGKLWLGGAPTGKAWNYGFVDTKASGATLRPNGLHMWQGLGAAHDRSHVDYSQTLRVVRPVVPCGHNVAPGTPAPPPASEPRPAGPGDSRAVIAAWQRGLLAYGGEPARLVRESGGADGIWGPGTKAATEAWRIDQTPTTRPPPGPGNEPPIVTCAAWGARMVPVQPAKPMVGIILHHMALGAVGKKRGTMRAPGATYEVELAASKALARNLQASHMAQKWVDTGQHFSVTRGGIILEGRTGSLDAARRGLVVRGSHAGAAANADHIGIEVEGDYTTGSHYGDTTPEVPEPQWRALVELVAWLLRTGALSVDAIRGHREVPGNATGCPGTLLDRLPELRATVR